MSSSCAAIGCENRRDEKKPELVHKGIDDKVLFKWLPAKSKKNLRDSWLSNIKRAGVLPKDNNFALCWEHFTSEGFERDIYNEFQAGDGKAVYTIKDYAVPTIFSFKKPLQIVYCQLTVKKSYKRKLVQKFCKDLSESTSSTSTTFEGESDIVIYVVVDDVEIETPSVKVDVSTNTTFIQVNVYTTNKDVDEAENIDNDNCSYTTVSSNDESEYEILNTDSFDSNSDFDECEK